MKYFELPQGFCGFIELEGKKVFAFRVGHHTHETFKISHVKGVSRGRALKRGEYDLNVVFEDGTTWFSHFLTVDANGDFYWYTVKNEFEMIDGSDFWTEVVKEIRHRREINKELQLLNDWRGLIESRGSFCSYLNRWELPNEFWSRVRRTPVAIEKGCFERNADYYADELLFTCMTTDEAKNELRKFLPADYVAHLDSLAVQNRAMAAACEREGSAKFTFGT